MSGPGATAGGRIERHLSVGSTNALARERARGGDPGGLWVVAERQTEGRGRRGRLWASEPGNLYASHLSLHDAPGAVTGLMPLAASLALREAIAAFGADEARLRLKWPNDVLVDGAKIAGILLEAERLADGRTAITTGFGVNCGWLPDGVDAAYPIARLDDLGLDVAPEALLHELDSAWTRRLAALAGGLAAGTIRRDWLSAARGLGDPITVRFETGAVSGRFADLDGEGRLLLERDDGRRMTIAAGDVFFGGIGAAAAHRGDGAAAGAGVAGAARA